MRASPTGHHHSSMQGARVAGGRGCGRSGAAGARRGALAAAGARKYTVKGGDTVYAIAGKYGKSVAELAEANPGLEVASVVPGQVIAVPGSGVFTFKTLAVALAVAVAAGAAYMKTQDEE